MRNGWLQQDAISDIGNKEFEMIQFDLEALMRLENWQDLDKVLSVYGFCHLSSTITNLSHRCALKSATRTGSKAQRI